MSSPCRCARLRATGGGWAEDYGSCRNPASAGRLERRRNPGTSTTCASSRSRRHHRVGGAGDVALSSAIRPCGDDRLRAGRGGHTRVGNCEPGALVKASGQYGSTASGPCSGSTQRTIRSSNRSSSIGWFRPTTPPAAMPFIARSARSAGKATRWRAATVARRSGVPWPRISSRHRTSGNGRDVQQTTAHRPDIDGLRGLAICRSACLRRLRALAARWPSRHRRLLRRIGLPHLVVDSGGPRERHFRPAVFLPSAGPPRPAGAAHRAARSLRGWLVPAVRPRVPRTRRRGRRRRRLRLQLPGVEQPRRRRHRHPVHLWSVAILGEFCLVWPALLNLTWRNRRGLRLLIPGFLILSFGVGLYWAYTHPAAAFIHHSRGSGS